jgi:F-type H+-transporting ATPase subunit b
MTDSSLSINLTAVLEAVVFIALVVFTSQCIFPQLSRALRNRGRRIANGLRSAERARQRTASAAREANEHIRQARVDAQEIINRAEAGAARILDEAKSEASSAISLAKAEARSQMETESVAAIATLKQQLPMLALTSAEKVIGRRIDASAYGDVLADLAKDL